MMCVIGQDKLSHMEDFIKIYKYSYYIYESYTCQYMYTLLSIYDIIDRGLVGIFYAYVKTKR